MVDKYLVVNKNGVHVYDGSRTELFDLPRSLGKIPAGTVIESDRKPIRDKNGIYWVNIGNNHFVKIWSHPWEAGNASKELLRKIPEEDTVQDGEYEIVSGAATTSFSTPAPWPTSIYGGINCESDTDCIGSPSGKYCVNSKCNPRPLLISSEMQNEIKRNFERRMAEQEAQVAQVAGPLVSYSPYDAEQSRKGKMSAELMDGGSRKRKNRRHTKKKKKSKSRKRKYKTRRRR
jgi:hypothetical protein